MFGQSTQNLEKNLDIGGLNRTLAYMPQDFFYNSTNIQNNVEVCGNYDFNNVQQENNCATLTNIDPLTGKNDNGYSCFNRELCKNLAYAQMLNDTNTAHSKSNKEFTDTNTQYNLETINMTNLFVGIVGTILIMYYA